MYTRRLIEVVVIVKSGRKNVLSREIFFLLYDTRYLLASENCVSMDCEITFRFAEESESDQVLDFLRKHFFSEEPINNAYPIKDESMEEDFILTLLPERNIIFAVDSSNDRIAGLASMGEITENYSRESWEESETTTNKKWRDILKFMSYIESKSRFCERFSCRTALHLHSVTVDKAYRGKSIGKLLYLECFRIAANRNYHLVTCDCTSIYSSRIAESVGMDCVSTVTYDEYNDKVGDKIFHPIPPHSEIKSFAKRI